MTLYKLGSVLKVVRGMNLPGKYYSKNGNLIRLTLGNFDDNGLFKENTSKKDIYYVGDVDDKYVLNENDIIIPLTEQSKGLLGSVARIPESNKYIQSRDIGLIKCKNDKLDKSFCYHLFSSNYIQNQISATAQQTKIRHTSPDKIENIIVNLPDLDYQKKVSSLLDSIVEKIIFNDKISAEIDLMINKIYEYWFVEFEFPTDNGKPYKSSDGKMVWDDILNQEIPLGWSIKSIVDKSVSTKIKTGVLPYNGKKNYLATSNIKNSKIIEGKWVSFDDRESRANMTPTENSVWFAKRKGSVKHLTLTDNCNWFKDKYILSTGFFGLKTDVNTISYLHCVVNSSFFEKQKDNLSTGATQIAINGKNLKNIKVIYPQRDILVRFSSIVNPLIQKKLDLIKENQELYSLKEYLLPLFINQQIVFRDS